MSYTSLGIVQSDTLAGIYNLLLPEGLRPCNAIELGGVGKARAIVARKEVRYNGK